MYDKDGAWRALLRARVAQGWTLVTMDETLVNRILYDEDSDARSWLEERLGPMVGTNDLSHHAPELWDVIDEFVIISDREVALMFKLIHG